MATTSFFLDTRGKAKDGKGSVLILLYHNHSTTTISTGVRIAKKNWKDQKIIGHPDAEALNAVLQKQKSKIDHTIAILTLEDSFANLTAPEIKKVIDRGIPKLDVQHKIADVYQEYLRDSDLKQGTIDLYNISLKKVIAFGGEDLKIEDMDFKWLRSFDAYLAKTQSVNGRSIYLRDLRAVFNYARRIKINCPYPFEFFKIQHEETLKKSIEVEKLREFYNYPTTTTNAYYRDYFFLIFFLIGINIKDLLTLKKSNLINGRIVYIRAKTGKKYSVKVEPEAQALIDKYRGKGEYLLEALDHCKLYKSFLKQLNRALRSIGDKHIEMVSMDGTLFGEEMEQVVTDSVVPDIGTYYARHSWVTLAYEIGIPVDFVSQAMGHSTINKTTLVYLKFDQDKVDEANRKVIDYFLGKTNPAE